MGKRNKDTSVGRRRPMIQLGSSQKQSVAAVSRRNVDEKVEETPETKPPEKPSAADMDDQLAGFLAEISSLDAPSTSATETTTPEQQQSPQSSQQAQEQEIDTANMLYDPETFDPATQSHLLPENWQACYDSNTTCYYYWNTVTNEVQWYPPVAMVPPPPPPPSQPSKDEEETQEVDKVEEEGIETLSNETDTDSNSNQMIEQQKETEGASVEGLTVNKEKDKELMNQIKERIRKKKEEKHKKELFERQKQEEELSKQQKEKEESLRERLIKKKLEREKSDDKTDKKSRKESEEAPTSTKTLDNNTDSFSVDIFAEDLKVKEAEPSNANNSLDSTKNTSDTDTAAAKNVDITESNNSPELESESTNAIPPVEPLIPNITADTNTNSSDTSNENTLATPQTESKGSWRIIDAVYDDDDEEDDETENQEDETEEETDVVPNKTAAENDKTDINPEKTEKKLEEMDDYADMLLEDAMETDDSNESSTPTPPSAPPPSAPPPPDTEEKPPLPPEDEPLPSTDHNLPEDRTIEEKKKVGQISTELLEKMDFLGINRKEIRNLQIYYIELETRFKDWQAGALDTKYFLERINELNVEIEKHEETAAPVGWLCHWSSEYKMYYYHNTTTGASQWDYPAVDAAVQQQQQVAQQPAIVVASHATPSFPSSQVVVMPQHIMPMMSLAATAYAAPVSIVMATPAINETTTLSVSAQSPAYGFAHDPNLTESKKRPADSDGTSGGDPYRDPYRMAKKKKESVGFPDQIEEIKAISEKESGTASPIPKSVIAAAPVIRDVSREGSPSLQSFPDDTDEPYSLSPKPENPAQVILNSRAKLKKKKKLDAGGLPSKKKKQVSSLVQKWQTVKQKVEEEENVDEEFEEEMLDPAIQSERRIEEWKKEIENSGKKGYNANFEEIKGDWRERLKRKTTT